MAVGLRHDPWIPPLLNLDMPPCPVCIKRETWTVECGGGRGRDRIVARGVSARSWGMGVGDKTSEK